MNNESDNGYKSVSVNISIDAESNRALSESASRARRPKRQEAELRLKDHLLNNEDVACVGRRFPWEQEGDAS